MPTGKIQFTKSSNNGSSDTIKTENTITGGAGVNNNALVILLASEALKPYAMTNRIELDSNTLTLCKAALQILRKDKASYDSVVTKVKNKRNTSLSVIASRLTEGQVEEEVEDEESMENYKNGTSTRERATPESAILPESFETLVNNTAFAVESLERAIREKSWSLMDAERAARCISSLTEPVPREVSAILYGSREENYIEANPEATTRNILVNLSRNIDKKLEKDLYVVTRRLLLKYYNGKSVDNMDGYIRSNSLTGDTRELGLLKDLDFEEDAESGIRYMTPDSLLKYITKFSNKTFTNITDLQTGTKKTINTALSESDQALLMGAWDGYIANGKAKEMYPETEEERKAEELLTNLFNTFQEENGGEKIDPEKMTAEEYHRVLLECIASVENDIADGEFDYTDNFTLDKVGTTNPLYSDGDGDNPGELDKAREIYITAFRFNQSVKNAALAAGIQAAMKDEDRLTRGNDSTPVFPFEVKFPLEMKNTGKKAAQWRQASLAVNRIKALPLAYILPSSIEGGMLINEALDMKETALAQARNARDELKDGLNLGREEIEETLREALEGEKMKPILEGWLKTEELRELFADSAKRALEAIKDITNENVLYETMQILDNSANAVIKKDSREVFKAQDEDGEFMAITPPALEKVTASIRFRVLTNLGVTHDVDESVPEGIEAYYFNGSGNVSFYNKIINECASPMVEKVPEKVNAKKNLSSWSGALEGYNLTMELINAIRSAGGGGCECCRIMDEAEEKAKDIFIRNYLDNLEKLHKTVDFLDELDAEGNEKEDGSNFTGSFMLAGKAFGEQILFSITEEMLKKAGFKEDAAAVKALSEAKEGKDRLYEGLSGYAKEVLSNNSILMTKGALTKIGRDKEYYEYQNANDSIWYDKGDIERESFITALTQGTMPYITEESFRNEVKKGMENYDVAHELSILAVYNDPARSIKLTETYSRYVEHLRKSLELTKKNIEFGSQKVDLKAAWEDLDRIEETLLSWTGTEEEREELDEYLTKLSIDNPLLVTRIDGFRMALDANEDESVLGMKRLVEHTDRLRYLSGFTYANRKNRNYSREDFIQMEDDYIKNIHAELTVRRNELEGRLGALTEAQVEELGRYEGAEREERQMKLAAENAALMNIAAASLFEPENNFIRVLADGLPLKSTGGKKKRFTSPDDNIRFGQTLIRAVRTVKNRVKKDFYKRCAEIVPDCFYRTSVEGIIPSPLMKGEKIDYAIVPGYGVVSTQTSGKTKTTVPMNQEFAGTTSQLDLQNSVFITTMNRVKETRTGFAMLLSDLSDLIKDYSGCFEGKENTFERSFDNVPKTDREAAETAIGFRKTFLDLRIASNNAEVQYKKNQDPSEAIELFRRLSGLISYNVRTDMADEKDLLFYDNTRPRPEKMEGKYTSKRGKILKHRST